ncbi:hypothetical protein KIN20_020076 [Parelaphostrongylus tenuis]|uniref:Secreted protein n=1 Tax=Parelaphostrongylus tenuis TaxID=148309 RepID=A0AAD5MM27_PARTN|nr:hypothetical protein KIN20_020076 [Parelaphostrongylus tenuis]
MLSDGAISGLSLWLWLGGSGCGQPTSSKCGLTTLDDEVENDQKLVSSEMSNPHETNPFLTKRYHVIAGTKSNFRCKTTLMLLKLS